MKHPNAIGPALRVYGRVLKQHWPMLLALTVAYPLVSWGASLAWKAWPVATGWVEIGLRGLQMLVWAMAWGLMGALLAQLTLATTDRRPSDPAALLRACASAVPVVAVIVLIIDASSLPLSLWRTHLAQTGAVGEQINLLMVLTLPFALLDAVAYWLLALAISARLDQDLSLIAAMKASARLTRKRWRTMLLVFVLTGVGVMIMMMALLTGAFSGGVPADGQAPSWMTDNYLWRIPGQVLSMAWILFWPSLYVVFRDQEGTGVVAETFD
jgi:hypothetical protein